MLNKLAQHADDYTGMTHVSRAEIMSATGLNQYDADDSVTLLIIGGWIERTGGGRGPGNTRRHRILMDGLPLQAELPVIPAASNAGPNAGPNAGLDQRELELEQNKDDDDARDHLHTIARAAPSSSFPVDLLIDSAAKQIAARKGKQDHRGYVLGTARNLRDERMAEIEGYAAEGLTFHQAIERLLADEPMLRLVPPPVDHPPSCACHGDGVIKIDDTGPGTYAQCRGVSA